MFYSSEANDTVLSPMDIVFFNSNVYDSWWQGSNCLQCNGEPRFYKTNNITRASIQITMQNKLWYIDQDVTSAVYRSKINLSNDTFIHSVYGSTLCHLWHHCLCHTSKFFTDDIAKLADGVPLLKMRNPFFSCGDCSSSKITDKIQGYNKDPERTIT